MKVPKGALKKNLALLAGHSAKALATPPPLLVSDTKGIMHFFSSYEHIYVFETKKFRHGKLH